MSKEKKKTQKDDEKKIEKESIDKETVEKEDSEAENTADASGEDEGAAGTAGAEDAAGASDDPEEAEIGGKAGVKIQEMKDRLLRQMAEFENFRKRSEKEKAQMFDMGARSVIEKILPVVDNFERGLETLTEEEKKEPFAQGVDKVYTQLMTELSGIGVTQIEALGCEFDPELHNAVMQTQTDEYESGQVAQELQKGYKYHDTVIRHSMVAVAE